MLPLSIHELRAALASGATFEYLLFYGHAPGTPDGCFSQWWPSPFTIEGQSYATAEHWMMASKARLFGDADALEKILGNDSPSHAKKVGRTVRGFDGARWQAACFDLVTQGNVAKFSSTDVLRAHLLGTGEKILVEAAATDAIWGIGLSASSPDARDPARWRGTNLLGFALVRARALMRSGMAPERA